MHTRTIELMLHWHYSMARANRELLNAISAYENRLHKVHVWEGLLEWAMYRSEAQDLLEKLK